MIPAPQIEIVGFEPEYFKPPKLDMRVHGLERQTYAVERIFYKNPGISEVMESEQDTAWVTIYSSLGELSTHVKGIAHFP